MSDAARPPTDRAGWVKTLAIESFNGAWDLIDAADRSPEDDRQMLLLAAASRLHWAEVGTAENIAVGDWQVAHVLSLLGYGDAALAFASAAHERVVDNGIGGYLVASTLEGVARAHAARGDAPARDDYLAKATAALDAIDDAEDRALIASQIDSVPR